MKKALLLCAFLSPVCVASGQSVFGIKAGLNIAKFNLSYNIPGLLSGTINSNDLLGFHGGIYMRAPLATNFTVQPELIYSMQGGSIPGGGGDLKLEYLNIPIMFRYHANEKFNFQAGPQAGFMLSARSGSNSGTDGFNTLDFSLCFGLGFEVGSGVDLGFRYNLGLSNIAKQDTTGAPAGTSVTMSNTVIQISVGYRLTKVSE